MGQDTPGITRILFSRKSVRLGSNSPAMVFLPEGGSPLTSAVRFALYNWSTLTAEVSFWVTTLLYDDR